MEESKTELKLLTVVGSVASIIGVGLYLYDKSLLGLALAFVSVIAALIVGFQIGKKFYSHGSPNDKVFRPEEGDKYNIPFHKYFNKKIKAARHEIYITGEGFDLLQGDMDGEKIAQKFVSAHRVAMEKRKGLKIIRVQTKSFESRDSKWSEYLRGLLTDFPQQFSLYITDIPFQSNSIPSICSIDDSNDEENTVEFMFAVPGHIGAQTKQLAGVGVFVEKDKDLSRHFKEKILTEISRSTPVTLVNFDSIMYSNVAYFSYGFNMDEKEMNKRCNSASKIGIGYIEDYQFVFNRTGTRWMGGVSGIEPSVGSRVYGVVYQLSTEDAMELDNIEDKKAYIRKEMEVNLIEADSLADCHVYLAIPEPDKVIVPNQEYLLKIIEAAKSARLPEGYIGYLISFKENDTQ